MNIIWWQVYLPDKVFGFSTKNNIIRDFPDRNMVGHLVTDHRNWFIRNNATVIKICEQMEICRD